MCIYIYTHQNICVYIYIYIYIWAFGKWMSATASFPHLWLSPHKTKAKRNMLTLRTQIRCVHRMVITKYWVGVSMETFNCVLCLWCSRPSWTYARSSATVEEEKFPFNTWCLFCQSCTSCHARSGVLSQSFRKLHRSRYILLDIALKTMPDQQDVWNGQAVAQLPKF